MPRLRKAAACLCLAVLRLACSLPAQALAADSEGEVPVLPPVTVVGTLENPASGRSVMDRKMIEALPAGNGSVNELLRLFPDVQVGEETLAGGQAGEILPPPISIAGGKTFDNAFEIDGLGNSNFLDPAADNPFDPYNVPGQPQTVFPQTDLIDRITLYDSNIPARYGGFTGGVIDLMTRDPRPDFGGSLFYRTTRDDWTSFHLAAGEEAPEFTKHHAGLSLDLPLSSHLGALASYQQLLSRLPRRHLDGSEVEERRLENYFAKAVLDRPAGRAELSFLATPYHSENFLPDIRDSSFSLNGGGYKAQAGIERFFPSGSLRLQGGYGWSRNERQAPSYLRQWATTDSHDWGRLTDSDVSYDGGLGDLEQTQQTVQLRSVLTLEPVRSGPLEHEIEAGLEFAWVEGTFSRPETFYSYFGARIDPDVVCGEDTVACVDEEQYFSIRRLWEAASVSARMQQYDLYLEDRLRTGRLTLRPGIRLSYDDFMRNLDPAPRLAASYDLAGNGRTLLIGGWNRYYGRTLLTYKLREAQLPYRSETRGAIGPSHLLQEWQPAKESGTSVTRFSRLDTPYSDEWTAGIDQALFGGRLSLKYVRRDGKDEFARRYGDRQPDGLRYYTLTNDGRSRHQSARLSWERRWPRHLLSLNVTWQESTVSNESYDEILAADETEDRIWYGGKIISKQDLPRQDFNRPWTVNLAWVGRLPYGFSFTNVTRYRSGFRAIVDTRQVREVPAGQGQLDPVTGEPVFEALRVYEKRDIAAGVVFDWVLSWQSPGKSGLLLSLEIDNAFNSRLETASSASDYEVGRQFWTEARLSF